MTFAKAKVEVGVQIVERWIVAARVSQRLPYLPPRLHKALCCAVKNLR